jgi:hypothetical protein
MLSRGKFVCFFQQNDAKSSRYSTTVYYFHVLVLSYVIDTVVSFA